MVKYGPEKSRKLDNAPSFRCRHSPLLIFLGIIFLSSGWSMDSVRRCPPLHSSSTPSEAPERANQRCIERDDPRAIQNGLCFRVVTRANCCQRYLLLNEGSAEREQKYPHLQARRILYRAKDESTGEKGLLKAMHIMKNIAQISFLQSIRGESK